MPSILTIWAAEVKVPNVRFGSKADMCVAKCDVCFTPDSDRESGHVPMVMSALPPKADMCGAKAAAVLPQFEYTPHHRRAFAANLGRGHPASTLIGICHEPARSPHFDALTDSLCKAQVCLGVQVRE